MKKIIIVFITLFCFFPFLVKANDVNYKIEHYYINADVQTNGDLQVTELLVLKGSFNGYIRDISFRNLKLETSGYASNRIYNAKNVELTEIAAKKVKDVRFDTMFDTDFMVLKKGQASHGGYLETLGSNTHTYKMFYQSKKDTIAFRITYTIKDVVVLHQDVAELYWTFIGSEYDDIIHDLIIKVTLPEIDQSDLFRVWAHGDLAGKVQKKDDKQIIATINTLDRRSEVDLRSTFKTELINEKQIAKVNPVSALAEILKVEEERAEIANKKRKQMKQIYYSFWGIGILFLFIQILVWVYVYKKYDKEYKSSFKNQYNREFIEDYNVEVIDYLMHKRITDNALSASIMNLIYKKAITYQEIATNKKKKKIYQFTKTEQIDNLSETEKYLILFLFEKIGTGNNFTTEELQDYARSPKTCESFSANYTTWKNKVIQEGKKQAFYENTNKAVCIGILFLFLGIILNVLQATLNAVVPIVYLVGFLSFVFFIYTLCFSKRTLKGNEHYVRWKAFRNFLNDFGTFKNKELPEIILWERYMVYATIFGLAEKVSKIMNVKIKELETTGMYVGTYPTFTDWYVFHSIHTNISSSIHANTSAVNAARAKSSSSSGSGFGGGFSSGGGFGGGGGGGRGF